MNPSKNHGKSRKIPQTIPQTLINESLKRSQERQVTKKRCSQAVIDPRDLVILVRGAIWNATDQTRAYGTALASRSSREVRVPGWLDSSSGITVVAEYPSNNHGQSLKQSRKIPQTLTDNPSNTHGQSRKQSRKIQFEGKWPHEKNSPNPCGFENVRPKKVLLLKQHSRYFESEKRGPVRLSVTDVTVFNRY